MSNTPSNADQRNRSIFRRTFFWRLCLPLTWLHMAVLYLRDFGYKTGLFRCHRFPTPVISIGNLSVGGTGKSPVTEKLAGRLLAKGYQTAVLSRGYGSEKKKQPLIFRGAECAQHSVSLTGDEPMMLAKKLPKARFYVFADRPVSAKLAAAENDFIVLDDGFQRQNIGKDIDILLIDAPSGLGNGYLLPAGRLRDLPRNMRRADAVIITKADQAGAGQIERIKKQVPAGTPVFLQNQVISGFYAFDSGERVAPDALLSKKIHAFCGLAVPDTFLKSLQALGFDRISWQAFPDHFRYSAAAVKEIMDTGRNRAADVWVTTQKDAVKLEPFRQQFGNTLLVADLDCVFSADFEAFFDKSIADLAVTYKLQEPAA